MIVTVYTRPNGHKREVKISNVSPDDAAFFESRGIALSMEDVGGQYAVYAKLPDREDEIVDLSRGRSCVDTLHALRVTCECVLSGGAA